MTYSVKEMFYTLQGEGARAGRASVFLRFAGCNLWTGREQDRGKAVCKFCDTQFVGTDGENGGKFKTAEDLVNEASRIWDAGTKVFKGRYVVLTGGEPTLQIDDELIMEFHRQGFEVAIETNGTKAIPAVWGVDWICVSPKAGAKVVQDWGNELKLVYPQPENHPSEFSYMEFDHFFISPRDCSFEPFGYNEGNGGSPQDQAVEYCLANPQWRLSLQTHKMLGLK